MQLANDEWRSMILFGLYTGQRLRDIATLRWNNLDLARGELRLSTRKTGKAIVLPLAASLRKQIECLLTSSNEPSAPVHPKAFDSVECQQAGRRSPDFAINMLDHVIVGQSFESRPGYFSFKEAGLI